ncbi:hypothetical protein JCM14469_28570 [Desulfatiferula olefinivorans]
MTDALTTHDTREKQVVLRLFVAGDARNSMRARENLRRFLDETPKLRCDLEIIDVLVQPEVMIEQNVFLTPALQRLKPQPERLIYGNLDDVTTLNDLIV